MLIEPVLSRAIFLTSFCALGLAASAVMDENKKAEQLFERIFRKTLPAARYSRPSWE